VELTKEKFSEKRKFISKNGVGHPAFLSFSFPYPLLEENEKEKN